MARISIVLSLVALAVAGSTSAAPPEPLRVLFVGNSLTQANDLPAQVARLAAATGRSLEYKTVAFGGFNLEDHWNQGDARTALATGDYDVLVMQQGPSALPESQVDLKLWAGRWADEARAAGTRPRALDGMARVLAAGCAFRCHLLVPAGCRGRRRGVYPAGAAWLFAWQCRPALGLYGPDGFHPSPLGTYAAALVVYGRLFTAPLRVAALGKPGVAAKTVRLLEWAAAKSLERKLPASSRCGR